MDRFGIDQAWQRLSPAEMKAAGKTFAVVYVSEDKTGKNATPQEVAAYHAAGIDVCVVYEYFTTAIHGGAAKGHHDAAIAIAGARALGLPAGCSIGFAVDENTVGFPTLIDPYAAAFTSDVHKAGWRTTVYGGYATVKRCAEIPGLADLLWQTYAWSAGQWYPGVAIRQVQNGVQINGKDIDLDTAMVDDFGQWKASAMAGVELDPVLTDRINQVWAVVGDAYAASNKAGNQPVKSIGTQVWEIHEALKNIATGGGLSDADRQLIKDQTAAINHLSDLLTKLGTAVTQ